MRKMLAYTLYIVTYLTYIMNEAECKPYTLPYRNPTDTEIENNTPIKISDTPIPDVDTAVEKKVIEYLVSKNYLRQEHFNTWENLKALHVLTPGEAQQMVRFKRKERKAILNLQKDYSLPQTGIVDNGVREIIFGSICGTADVDDEDSYEEKKR